MKADAGADTRQVSVGLKRAEAEEFLFEEAALLDGWRLDEWLDLVLPEVRYLVPTTSLPEGDSPQDVVFIDDDILTLRGRVARLQSRLAHREYPASRTRRLVTNVRVRPAAPGPSGPVVLPGDVQVLANFAVYRFRMQQVAVYVGRYEHVLRQDASGSWKFLVRKAVLDNEYLAEHGAVSIIV
jgi:p-cumate 2,3-dioxygenase beta subunit